MNDNAVREQSSTSRINHILFLTTHPLTSLEDPNWNLELLPALESRSTRVSTLSYLDCAPEQCTPTHLASTYTHICLLLLGHYPPHYSALLPLLRDVLPAALAQNPNLRIYPGPQTALWNSDKSYLGHLRDAGFPVPETRVLKPRQSREEVKTALASTSHGAGVVVKPSIGASGGWTHFVQNPSNLTEDDERFLQDFVNFAQGNEGGDEEFLGSIMLQEYIPEIKDGEYSLCFVGGRFLYTILKRPRSGGWQVNSEHGGTHAIVPETDVPASAQKVARDVVEWLQWVRFPKEELAYVRVDGVVRSDGAFVLMEVELIEPSLFLDMVEQGIGQKGVDALCNTICRS